MGARPRLGRRTPAPTPTGAASWAAPAWSAGCTTPRTPAGSGSGARPRTISSRPTATRPCSSRRRRARSTYLRPFGATAMRPADGDGFARLLHEDDIDLLHFAGHGRSDDSSTPPVREMLLAGARRVESRSGRRAARSKVAFGLDDLQRALADRPQRPEGVPGPLVVLNACRLGQAPSTRSEVGGFAETFLRGGAGAFVGCLWSVGDEPARAFVEAFYAELDAARASPRPRRGRRGGASRGDLSWLAYTVYAHPDATLIPDRPQHAQKGTVMTTTATSRPQGPALSRAQLVALHPYVIDMPDGKLADGRSTAADQRQGLQDDEGRRRRPLRHLPALVHRGPRRAGADGRVGARWAGRQGRRARGRQPQVDWWKANGVFPVHFVWETGLAESLWDAVKDSLPGSVTWPGSTTPRTRRSRSAVRAVPAAIATWGAMKTTARLASEKDNGGAWYFAQQLAEFIEGQPRERHGAHRRPQRRVDLPLLPDPGDPRRRSAVGRLARPAGARHPGRRSSRSG